MKVRFPRQTRLICSDELTYSSLETLSNTAYEYSFRQQTHSFATRRRTWWQISGPLGSRRWNCLFCVSSSQTRRYLWARRENLSPTTMGEWRSGQESPPSILLCGLQCWSSHLPRKYVALPFDPFPESIPRLANDTQRTSL